MWKEWIKAKRFGNFYIYFCEKGIDEWKMINNIVEFYDVDHQIIAECCYEMIKDIPIRTLIYDMHMANLNGKLLGTTDTKKYCYYNEIILSNREYLVALETKYPELFRIINLRVKQCVIYLIEIIDNLHRDRKKIVDQLCNGVSFKKIEKLSINLSDSHENGKTIAKMELDNRCKIVYKPHGLWKELHYQKLYDSFCNELRIENKKIEYVDEENHGWEIWIEHHECKDNIAIKRYYFRMGIHLFLGYLFAATDLHAENIIADGEFPIILDMETYPGLRDFEKIETSEEKANNIIKYSVLRTGLLPSSNFGEKQDIIVNAIHPIGIQEGTVALPVIENDGSVNMKIGYKKPVVNLTNSLPMINGGEVNPYLFTEELINGFTAAFMLWLEKKDELIKNIQQLLCQKFRVILRNTQQYVMLLSTSLHPQFMVSKAVRKDFLLHLKKNNLEGDDISGKIQDYEVDSMLNLDIPIFYGKGSDCSLYLGHKERLEQYYKKSHFQNVVETLRQLTVIDLEIQKRIIGLSMIQIKPKNSFLPNINTGNSLSLKECIIKIADFLCNTAIVDNQGGVTWVGVQGGELPIGKFVPIGEDLYNGVPGVAIFFEKLLTINSDDRYRRILNLVKKRMFNYTIERVNGIESLQKMPEKNKKHYNYTGGMLGIGSNVYAYLILYKISGDSEYLKYAEQHAELLVKNYLNDEVFDFLSGNAGAIYVLCRLYFYTQKEQYLNSAMKIGDWLWEKAINTEYGWGWIIPGQKIPLTGMAHGNSGFILAYSELMKYTKKNEYKTIIEELLKYEDHYYSKSLKNWVDLRGNENNTEHCVKNQNTWCNGASGILLSRIKLFLLEQFSDNDSVRMDINNALERIKEDNEIRHMCLCHGECGNWLILNHCADICKENKQIKRIKNMLAKKILMRLYDFKVIERMEVFHSGFMDGISGIGYMLLVLSENLN